MRLTDVRYASGRMAFRSRHATEPEWALEGYLEEARQVLLDKRPQAPVEEALPPEVETLRWFSLPSEAGCTL